ncbi:MAG TPA: DNA polymerase Y family protein [Burkholderiaceae bacterium]|nr:DNA polymerase Y family protein [Burkholderiaceae bacterium]
MLWIAVHLPQLSLESFAATLDPTWQGRPLALIEAHRIAQVDARAAALGVQPGAKRATALALASDLVLGEADAARDASALQAVGHAALAFTPMVCHEATDGAGAPAPVVLLEVQASLRCFGGLRPLLQQLGQALRPLGHRCRVASAPTALGAALLARWRDDLAHGAHSTDLTALRRLLDDAPVWLLGPGREHWEALQGMGLKQLSDLRHLPRAGLARRFGVGLLADLDRARGDAPDPREPIVPPPKFEQRIELFSRADNAEQLLAGARVLIARLLAWARARHARVSAFTLRMHHEARRGDAAGHSELTIGLAEPSADAVHLQSLLGERLVRTPLVAPALELSLRCDALVQSSPPSGELFATRSSEREGLTRLIERLQARLGADGVRRLVLLADHRPERAMAWRSAEAGLRAPIQSATPASIAPTRPLWLLPEPQPLHEQAARPWLDGGPLQLLAGPERIESGWWDGALTARDYFIARANDGALVWIFRARLPLAPASDGSGWFLQGRFA